MKPADVGYFPKPGESSFKIVTVPGRAARATMPGRTASLPAELLPYFDPDDPEVRTTDTIDHVVILAGSADLEPDHGRKEGVQAGDCVVQSGTRHAWRVTSDEPLMHCAALIGGQRR